MVGLEKKRVDGKRRDESYGKVEGRDGGRERKGIERKSEGK